MVETETEQYDEAAILQELQNLEGVGSPTPNKGENFLRFFRDVLAESDPHKTSKSANLDKIELGLPRLSVRDSLRLAEYAKVEGYEVVSDYLNIITLITNNTSLGKNAKLLEMVVTQQRVNRNIAPVREVTKRGLFGSTTVKEGGDNVDN